MHHKADAKILNTRPTNGSDIINVSMETVGNDLIGDLEKGGEHLSLLGSHGHRKTLVFYFVLKLLVFTNVAMATV